jgi:hypothetical protein
MSENPPRKFRRGGLERRGWQKFPKPPFVDSDGVLVTEDRRKILDRRKGDEAPDSEETNDD